LVDTDNVLTHVLQRSCIDAEKLYTDVLPPQVLR